MSLNLYKNIMKNPAIIIRIQIIKDIIINKLKIVDVAIKYQLHRNTVSNILNLYKKKSSK
jgi:hypothetical protein